MGVVIRMLGWTRSVVGQLRIMTVVAAVGVSETTEQARGSMLEFIWLHGHARQTGLFIHQHAPAAQYIQPIAGD